MQVGYYLLDLNYQIAGPYIPQRYVDEMKGIVAGSNGLVDEKMLIRVNMVPELTQASCTVFGAWGPATVGGKLYHMRALDWEPRAQVNQFPAVVLYESNEEGSHPFANIGYLGLIGSLTAMSKIGISMGEKVIYVDNPKDWPIQPHVSYWGKPWMFLLRDTVQFANNIVEAEAMLQDTTRTMMIHFGLGSLPDKTFRGGDMAHNFITFYDDKNYTHYRPEHPQFDGIFYYDKGIQPSVDLCIGSITKGVHGQIVPENMFRDIAGFHETGDAQVIVMDPEDQVIWGMWSLYNSTINAYTRAPIRIDLKKFYTPSTDSNFLA